MQAPEVRECKECTKGEKLRIHPRVECRECWHVRKPHDGQKFARFWQYQLKLKNVRESISLQIERNERNEF